MKFIDYAKIYIKSGDGGNGHISFRKEKYVPKGGPDGGNGGKGGDIIFKVNKNINTLLDFKYKRKFIAQNGQGGGKSRKTGKDGKGIVIQVPSGTVVKSAETDEIIADLTENGFEYILAPGGKGGRGNSEFATPTNQAPRYAEPGVPGIEMEITLELKLIADVGIVGFPNSGKSTLISTISSAKPKIAEYPFTTLIPNLGIVKIGEMESYAVADIPGIIEGASDGKGLGIQFLRHIERTSILLFLIDSTSDDVKKEFSILKNELIKFNPDLNSKKMIIAFSKSDLISPEKKIELLEKKFGRKKIQTIIISSIVMENIEKLKKDLWLLDRKSVV